MILEQKTDQGTLVSVICTTPVIDHPTKLNVHMSLKDSEGAFGIDFNEEYKQMVLPWQFNFRQTWQSQFAFALKNSTPPLKVRQVS